MVMSIAITGSRDLGSRRETDVIDAFGTLLLPFARTGARWVLGGAAGVDTMALDWLAGLDHAGEVLIAVPVTVADQPREAQLAIRRAAGRLPVKVVELCHPSGAGPAAWTARNRYMVGQSGVVIGFPATDMPDASGTWETLEYARLRGRALITVPPSWPGASRSSPD